MFDIEKGSRVFYGGNKWVVAGVSDGEVKLQDVRGWPYVPRDAVKPIIRLTPLVRAELRLKAERQTARPRSTRMSPKMWEVSQSVSLIQSIGGYEAAQLYTDCDGYVNGCFIRGDDVRRALRILEGL